MDIIDYITADQIEPADIIFHFNDYVEVTRIVDETNTIMVEGMSHITGDNVTYMIPADTTVGVCSY